MGDSPGFRAARAYCARGWSPIPVVFRGKAPHPSLGKEWQNLRLTDSDLAAKFGSEPRNVGVILGEASSGLLDVDLDCAETVLLADDLLVPTSSIFGRASKPRSHRLYRMDGSHRTVQFKDVDGTMLVELRGEGGQSVFPGSVHESGEAVEWALDGDPALLAYEELAKSVRVLASAAILARHWPSTGSRHEAALALGGWLARASWPLAEVERFVFAVARAAHDEEASKRSESIRGTFQRLRAGEPATGGGRLTSMVGELVFKRVCTWLNIAAEAKVPQRPGKASRPKRRPTIPGYVPFPIHVLPEPIRSFVNEFAVSLGCDPAYLAVPVFGVLGAAVGNSRTIQLKVGWTEPAVVWSIIVAASGTLKSPALDAVLAPLRRFQIEGVREHRDAVADHARRMKSYKRELKQFNKGKSDEPPREPQEPTLVQYFCEDTTVEALAVILNESLRGTLLTRDELSGWLRSFNQYKGGKGGDEAHWLSMHGARTLTINRKTGDQPFLHVPRAAVSIVGGIQPGVLSSALSQDHMNSGMAARMLFAYPPRKKKLWTEAEASEWTKDDYTRVTEALYRLQPTESASGIFVPVDVPLSPEAKRLWVQFYDEHAAEQVAMTGTVAAAWSKLEGYAARLALIVHCVREAHGDIPVGSTVDATSMQAGIDLSRWFGNEALRVYTMLRVEDEDRELLERVEAVAALGGQVTPRHWQRSRRHTTAADAEDELQELVDAELGLWRLEPSGPTGGRPQKWFVATRRDNTPPDDDGDGVSSVSRPQEVLECNSPRPGESAEEDKEPAGRFHDAPGTHPGTNGASSFDLRSKRSQERDADETPAGSDPDEVSSHDGDSPDGDLDVGGVS